jgi:hypothetical protein
VYVRNIRFSNCPIFPFLTKKWLQVFMILLYQSTTMITIITSYYSRPCPRIARGALTSTFYTRLPVPQEPMAARHIGLLPWLSIWLGSSYKVIDHKAYYRRKAYYRPNDAWIACDANIVTIWVPSMTLDENQTQGYAKSQRERLLTEWPSTDPFRIARGFGGYIHRVRSRVPSG